MYLDFYFCVRFLFAKSFKNYRIFRLKKTLIYSRFRTFFLAYYLTFCQKNGPKKATFELKTISKGVGPFPPTPLRIIRKPRIPDVGFDGFFDSEGGRGTRLSAQIL